MIDKKVEFLLKEYQHKYENILEVKRLISQYNDNCQEGIISEDLKNYQVGVLKVSLKLKEIDLLKTKEKIITQMIRNVDDRVYTPEMKGILITYTEAKIDIQIRKLVVGYEKLRAKIFGIDTSEDVIKAQNLIIADQALLRGVNRSHVAQIKNKKHISLKQYFIGSSKCIDDITKSRVKAKQKVISQ